MNGWIKLYRKFCEWEWFNISEMVHLFIYILLNANHEDGKWRGIEIKRGQLLTGRKVLNEKTGISEQTIRTCLKKLENTKEITIESTNQYSIITICNYESYQDCEIITNQQTNQQLTSDQPTTNQQLTTNKKNKNKKNDNKKEVTPDKPDFIEEIIQVFQESYFEVNQIDYIITNKEKERSCTGKLLGIYKKKHPDLSSEQTLEGFKKYFEMVLQIKDDWIQKNMSLPIILLKFNDINKILKNGVDKKTKGQPVTSDRELAQTFINNFGTE